MRGIFTGICTSCVSLPSPCCYPFLSHTRYFTPGGQKQWVLPGDGACISYSELSCPETSQTQTFTPPAQPAHVSPHSTASTIPDCTEKFQEQKTLENPVQLWSLSLKHLQLQRSPKEPSCQAQACTHSLCSVSQLL